MGNREGEGYLDKRILIVTMQTPGYAPSYLADYLDKLPGYEVVRVIHPNKFHRDGREPFIPIYSHWINAKLTRAQVVGNFDIAIAPDPSLIWALKSFRKSGQIKKLIYWRLDYYPYKYPGPLNTLYQMSERAAQNVDEVWSMADPEDERVAHSLRTVRDSTLIRYVPFLQPKMPEISDVIREDQAIWMGPDLDDSRPMGEWASKSADIDFFLADYSSTGTWLSEQELADELSKSKVGIALYRPFKKSFKYYSDPSRIRTSLAYGLPVVTTKVAPLWRELEEREAGFAPEWKHMNMEWAVREAVRKFPAMSKNALEMARDYVMNEKWIQL